eukprot:1529071-Prymnesium_polylepis.1
MQRPPTRSCTTFCRRVARCQRRRVTAMCDTRGDSQRCSHTNRRTTDRLHSPCDTTSAQRSRRACDRGTGAGESTACRATTT